MVPPKNMVDGTLQVVIEDTEHYDTLAKLIPLLEVLEGTMKKLRTFEGNATSVLPLKRLMTLQNNIGEIPLKLKPSDEAAILTAILESVLVTVDLLKNLKAITRLSITQTIVDAIDHLLPWLKLSQKNLPPTTADAMKAFEDRIHTNADLFLVNLARLKQQPSFKLYQQENSFRSGK